MSEPVRGVGADDLPVGTIASTQVRGSALLLVGRFIAIFLDLVAHVIIVRYLAKNDYGAFAYGLAIVSIGSSLAVLGLDKTIGRFAPIYEEERKHGHYFGTVILAIASIAALGAIIVIGYVASARFLSGTLIGDPLAASLLLILILLVPVQAIDAFLQATIAVLGRPRIIFARRYVLAPIIQLLVVAAVIGGGLGVVELAVGYVVAGVVGIGLYGGVLMRLLQRKWASRGMRVSELRVPVRRIFGFTLPLLSSDLVFVLRSSLAVILLEIARPIGDVAAFRAVLPLGRQNSLVYRNFTILYTPAASRLYAQHDHEGLNQLYWVTALWIAVLTAPILLLTFSLAGPLTVLLFGPAYADAAPVMAILAVGFYFNAALGFNGLTLRVFGTVRYLVSVDLATAIVGIVAQVILIQTYGVIGAAIGTTGILVVQNVLYHVGVHRRTPIHAFEWRYLRTYVWILGIAVLLLVADLTVAPPAYLMLAAAAAGSALIFVMNRDALRVADTFPEVRRIPLVRRLFR